MTAPAKGFCRRRRFDGLRSVGRWAAHAHFDSARNASSTDQANPNQSAKTVTYAWADTKVCATCIPGDKLYQPGEEGNVTSTALAGAITVDPNLKQPSSTQATTYVEQQITEGVGARVGFVYLGVSNQTGTFQPLRPASGYTVPFVVADVGDDGISGTADDATRTFYGIPSALISAWSADQ